MEQQPLTIEENSRSFSFRSQIALAFFAFSVIGANDGAIGVLIPIGIISAIGLCLTGFCLGPLFPTIIALMPQLFAKRLLATTIGLVVSLSCVGGALFPWLSGNLAQAFGLWIILPLALALTVMMFTLWLLLQLQQNSSQTVPSSK
jgi:fucose permease